MSSERVAGRPAAGVMFGFVQMEFTHAIGPEPGSYVVAPQLVGATPPQDAMAALDPVSAQLTGVGRSVASSDVLLVDVVAAPAALRPGLRALRRGTEPAPAAITVVTHVRATEPLAGAEAARLLLERWRSDEDEQQRVLATALDVLNVAVRAQRVITGDPYTVEVAREDARAVRVGFGTGGDLRRGAWTQVHELRRRTQRLGRGELARAPTYVAAVLGGEREPLDSEDLLLRALLDRAHGRDRAAAVQAAGALELLVAELAERGQDEVRDGLRAKAQAASHLRQAALAGPLGEKGGALLDDVVAAVESALGAARDAASPPGASGRTGDGGPPVG